jgi:hypothetical protein
MNPRVRALSEEIDGAWIERPATWMADHYELYMDGYVYMLDKGRPHPIAQLAGALMLIQQGIVTCDVPGLEWDGREPVLHNLKARALGFIRQEICMSLEHTQVVPILPLPQSPDGTAAQAATEKSPEPEQEQEPKA